MNKQEIIEATLRNVKVRKLDKHQKYNGWPNWFTWNVALWLENDYYLMLEICAYVNKQRKKGESLNYDEMLEYVGIEKGEKTPDGVAFYSPNVNREAMRIELAGY